MSCWLLDALSPSKECAPSRKGGKCYPLPKAFYGLDLIPKAIISWITSSITMDGWVTWMDVNNVRNGLYNTMSATLSTPDGLQTLPETCRTYLESMKDFTLRSPQS